MLKVDLLTTPLHLSASSCLGSFNFNIEELIDLGEPKLAEAVSRLKPTKSFAVLYSCQGEVRTEILPKEYFQLLKQLDGHQLGVNISKSLGICAEEAIKFLKIALHEGIIVTVKK